MSLLRTLYRNENHFDFIGTSRRVLTVSGALVLLSLGALLIRGVNSASSSRVERCGRSRPVNSQKTTSGQR